MPTQNHSSVAFADRKKRKSMFNSDKNIGLLWPEISKGTEIEDGAHLQILGSPVDCLEGVIGAGMITFVRVDEQTQSPVALLDVCCLRIRLNTHNGIRIRLRSSALENPAF